MTNSNSLVSLVGNTNNESGESVNSTPYWLFSDDEDLTDGTLVETPPITDGEEIPNNIQNIGVFNGNSSIDFSDSIEADGHPDVYQFSTGSPQ